MGWLPATLRDRRHRLLSPLSLSLVWSWGDTLSTDESARKNPWDSYTCWGRLKHIPTCLQPLLLWFSDFPRWTKSKLNQMGFDILFTHMNTLFLLKIKIIDKVKIPLAACNKLPPIGQFNTIVLEARHPRSGCQQVHAPGEDLFYLPLSPCVW